MKRWWVVLLVAILIVVGVLLLVVIPTPQTAVAPTASSSPQAVNSLPNLLTISTPTPGSTVKSPLTIQGEARGSFYFEAVFPVELKDSDGNVIAQGQAQAQSSWTTTDFVPFVATLTFSQQPAGSTGTLVLKNANASGDPANQKELDIPVKF